MNDIGPPANVAESRDIRPNGIPKFLIRLRAQSRKPRLYVRERSQMQHLCIHRLQFIQIELRRRVRNFPDIEFARQRFKRRLRHNRIGCPQLGQKRIDRHRLDLHIVAHARDRQRAEPLAHLNSRRADNKREMRERRRRRFRQRGPNLDLHSGIGHMIFAANDMRRLIVDVVNDRAVRIKRNAIRAHQNRIGNRRSRQALMPLHQIVPSDIDMVEPKPPMRPTPLGLERGALLLRQFQRRAVVNRRQPASQLRLALKVQLGLRFITRINPPQSLQPFQDFRIPRGPVRLSPKRIPRQPQPCQIALNRLFVFRQRARLIGIVETQHKRPAVFSGEKIIEQRRPDIANMQQPGR